MKNLGRDFASVGICVFGDGSASLKFGGRADLYRKPVHYLRGLLTDSDGRNGTWRSPRAVCVRAAETCAEQVLRAPPAFQARMEGRQSAEEDAVFHVKHFFIQDDCPPSFRFSLSF